MPNPPKSFAPIDRWVRAALVETLARLAPLEGYNLTPLPGVRLLRSNRSLARTPVLYEPGIAIVCQGRKRGFLGDDVYVYDAHQYLAVSVPLPFTMETDATPDKPLLAIYLSLDTKVAAELAVRLDGRQPRVAHPKAMVSSPLDAPLAATLLRLLEAVESPLACELLGPSLVRELYFRVLVGEQGDGIRAALSARGHFRQIAKALERIHAELAGPIVVTELAREAGMSAAAFHAHFKALTALSPMQYVKSTRLHQARMLLVRSDMTAAAASYAVGYESQSQFSREFRRLFGLAPLREAERLRTAHALPASADRSRYVSSH